MGKPMKPQPYIRNCGQLGVLRMGEWFSPGKSVSDGCPILKGQPETIHTCSTVQTGHVVLTDSERQTHTVTADENRGHERQWGCGKGLGRMKGRGRWYSKNKKYFNNNAVIAFLLDSIYHLSWKHTGLDKFINLCFTV